MKKGVYVSKEKIELTSKIVKEEDSQQSIVSFIGLILNMIDGDMGLPHTYKKTLKEKIVYLQKEIIK